LLNWLARACVAQAGFCVPSAKNGIGPEDDEVKSAALPKKFHRSLPSPVRLMSLPVSTTFQGCPVSRVTIEFTCQPCRICAGDFFLGQGWVEGPNLGDNLALAPNF
jgi:hypothetical protein